MSIPLWPLALALTPVLDDKDSFLVVMLALAATLAALTLHLHDRMDDRLAKGLAAQKRAEADIALLSGAAIERGMAAPMRRASGGLPVLRSVPDYPAS